MTALMNDVQNNPVLLSLALHYILVIILCVAFASQPEKTLLSVDLASHQSSLPLFFRAVLYATSFRYPS